MQRPNDIHDGVRPASEDQAEFGNSSYQVAANTLLPNQAVEESKLSWFFVAPWTKLLAGVWITGSLCWFLLAGTRLFRFRKLLRYASPASKEMLSEVNSIAARYGLHNVPSVLVVDAKIPPLIWGFGGRSSMVLPSGLLNRLGTEERAGLLAHELAHLRRYDHWIRWFEFVVLGIYWWNPIAWWARAQIQQAEEECCDGWVLWAFPDEAHGYAQTLVDTVEFLAGSPGLKPDIATAFNQGNSLKRRIEMIVSNRVARRLSWRMRVVLVLFALVVAPLSLLAQNETVIQRADWIANSQSPKRPDNERTAGSPSTPESKAIRNEEVTARGQVLLPDRELAVGAMVIVPEDVHTSMVHLEDGEFPWMHRCTSTKTDAEGRFELRLPDSRAMIIVRHENGSSRTNLKELAVSGQVKLEPWATLDGIVRIGVVPAVDARVSLSYERPQDQEAYWIDVGYGGIIQTNTEGRFVCRNLMPGLVRVARMVRESNDRWGLTSMTVVELLPGKTTKVILGGSGRPVVGRMVLPTDFKGHIDMAQGSGSLFVGIPPADFPEGYDQMTSSQKRAFLKKWWDSPEAKEAQRTRKQNSFNVLADGTFRAEDIEPGWYSMYLCITELRTTAGVEHLVVLGSAIHKFEVPEMATEWSEPLDVGTIELNVYRQFQVGEQAPDFSAKTADGESISLADYRGKYLLLNFWDTGGPNNIIMPLLRKINARYADDPRFALVGLNTDQFTDVAIEYSKEKEFAGIQGYLGQKSKVQTDYGADETPSTFLIGLDGKIIARWIQDGLLTDIEATLHRALPSPE